MTNEGISPVNTKIQEFTGKLRPGKLKELRSLFGAVHQFNKFIPNLARVCFSFRSIFKKDATWNWTHEHEKASVNVNKEVNKGAELTHFKRNKPKNHLRCEQTRTKGRATTSEGNECKPNSYLFRFSTDSEAKISINEIELLAVVWSGEPFKHYVYGVAFGIDHKALQCVLKANKGNKTYYSRLTRWVDRLLPFSIVHAPGRTLGMADYL